MKLKDLFGKKIKTNSEKVVIKIDKKQLEKITGGAEETHRIKVKFPVVGDNQI
jgi:hypothetical protein